MASEAEEEPMAAIYLRELMDILSSEEMEQQGRQLRMTSLLDQLLAVVRDLHSAVGSVIAREINRIIETAYDDLLAALDEILLRDQLRADACYQKPLIFFSKHNFHRVTTRKLKKSLASLKHVKTNVGTSGVRPPSGAVGREGVVEEMVRILLRSDEDEMRPLLLPIVGGAGIGKSSLAQTIYEDDRVRSQFDVRSWLFVSDYFNIMDIFTELTESIFIRPQNFTVLTEVQQLVSMALSGKKYLIVLDDVWNVDKNKWKHLFCALPNSRGSKIILTTRINTVVSCMVSILPSIPPYFVKPLEQDDSLSLLRENLEPPDEPWVAEVGKRIAGKCRGVPKLLKHAGQLLSSREVTESEWGEFLSKFDKFDDEVLKIASPSYWNLLPDLQRCLLYCSSNYPSERKFDAEELCSLLVTGVPIKSTITDCQQLLDECFYPVEPSGQVGKIEYRMHEILHMFTQQLDPKESGYRFLREKEFLKFQDLKTTVLTREKAIWSSDRLCDITEIPQLFCQQLRHIQGLNLKGFKIKMFPKNLELLFIRHLNLSSTDIEIIPGSISKMECLEILKLSHCGKLQSLDKNVGNLVRLKKLNLEGCKDLVELPDLGNLKKLGDLNLSCTGIKKLPSSFGKLQSLRTLKLCQCKELQNLHGNTIRKLFQLKELDLEGCKDIVELPNLSKLKKLEDLNLSWTGIKKIPSSFGKLQSLHMLKLRHCRKLQNLNGNTISKLDQLRQLDLEGCKDLVALPQNMSTMKSLVYLNVLECSSLIEMPKEISQLTGLETLLGYVVSNNDGCKISELQSLPKLGNLCLESLDKFSEKDVGTLGLKVKKLSLRWNVDAKSTASKGQSVLEYLKPQPHQGLEELEIVSYQEVELPSWIISPVPYLESLVEIRLTNLKACETLPPLGLLAHLKIAEIVGAEAICTVDNNFYGSIGTFPCLEKLTFCRMPKLEVWKQLDGTDVFPCLAELVIIQCPNLTLKVKLPSVNKLALGMNNKKLYGSEGGIRDAMPKLKYISVSFCEEFRTSPDCMGLQHLRGLQKLEICGCDEMADLPDNLGTLSSLEHLTIDNCSKLETLPCWLNNFESLKELHLSGCPILGYISENCSWPILLNISQAKSGIEIFVKDCLGIEIFVKDCPKLSAQSSGIDSSCT